MAPRDDSPLRTDSARTDPPSRVYRSREPERVTPTPAPDRGSDRPANRAADRGAVSRQPERNAPAAPHIESRETGAPPSRGGSDNGSSSSRSSSGQGQGQAVRRGGER